MDNYKGYSLFNDIEDSILRNRNRAVLMANITEFNTKNNKITPKGAALLLGYFNQVPMGDREIVMKNFETQVKERGYATRSN